MDIAMNYIPVIASFNTKGDIKPLYVMVDGIQLKVIECYEVHKDSAFDKTYNCIVSDNKICKNVQLHYSLTLHNWTLKM